MAAVIDIVFSAAGPIIALCVLSVWAWRADSCSRAMRRFAIAAAVCYWLASVSVVPYSVGRVVAAGYHQLRASQVPPGTTAIVLLGGGDQFVRGWSSSITVTTPVEAERVLEAARVFALISPAWIISSGGLPDWRDRGDPSAVTMRDELVRLGVPAARIIIEKESRSTRENATFVTPLLKSLAVDHVVLVTSEAHMRRSTGAFRALGVETIPAVPPGGDAPSAWQDWFPREHALEWSGSLAREIGGIAYYWLRGWWRR